MKEKGIDQLLEDARESNRENDLEHLKRGCELLSSLSLSVGLETEGANGSRTWAGRTVINSLLILMMISVTTLEVDVLARGVKLNTTTDRVNGFAAGQTPKQDMECPLRAARLAFVKEPINMLRVCTILLCYDTSGTLIR